MAPPSSESHRIVNNIDTKHFQQRKPNANRINIESTVTPLRSRPFVRQQSMLVNNGRRMPPPTRQQHSFDVSQTPNSQHCNSQQPITSYHQKLLQLQLMHDSNHAHHGRNINGAINDQQIYGPGSNHYGYYSMRSNLRSAASEFSFIRPSSSDFNAPQQQPPPVPTQQAPFDTQSDSRGVAQLYNHSNAAFAFANTDYANHLNGRHNSAQMTPAHSQNPVQDSIRAAEQFNNYLALNGFTAPTRELPLKPNKKRQHSGDGSHKSSSSSTAFGSSIAHFFRRAFSRRSKRRPQMVESCSSSLGGPHDDQFESIQRARSAVSASEGLMDQQHTSVNQQHRMIDLIEAFANKTAINNKTYSNLLQTRGRTDLAANHLTPMRTSIQNDISIPSKLAQYQQQPMVNSPLHKSNSISTSSGLSGLNEMMRLNERQVIVNGPASPALNARNNGPMWSPLITRSTKVMSVHLTPVAARKETFDHHESGYLNSPRRPMNFEQQPRPSSIYGQPSLICSPMNVQRDQRGGDFGSHRSSIHSYHQRPERVGPSNSNIDMRRHYSVIKAPYLDTTREVAEEVSSPTTESKNVVNHDLQNNNRRSLSEDRDGLVVSNGLTPMNQVISKQRRSRIVNPILQSPTMSLIYDNHPMPMSTSGPYSHYDNHRPIEHQQSLSSMDLSTQSHMQPLNESKGPEVHGHGPGNSVADTSSPVAAYRNSKLRQPYKEGILSTPSHRDMRLFVYY